MWHVPALLAAVLLGAFQGATASQPSPVEAPQPEVLIRVSSADRERTTSDPEGRSVALLGFPLRMLLSQVHTTHPLDIVASGGVDLGQRYDVLLRSVAPEDRKEIRALLADRIPRELGLSVRPEERTVAINRLTRLPNEPALEPSGTRPARFETGRGRIAAPGPPLQQLVWFLRWRSPRPIVDEAALGGRYDFVLEWDSQAGTTALFLALHDLGLSILPGKGTTTLLVVEPAP